MAKEWASIRTKTEAKAFDAVRARILGYPEKVAEEVYWPALQSIASEGVTTIRQIILSSTTPTGEARAAKGGKPGRYDTGNMFKNVRMRLRKRAKGFTAFVGWIEGKPGYAIFQEMGTKNGVRAMEAIVTARQEMYSKIQALGKGRYSAPNNPQLGEDGGEDATG